VVSYVQINVSNLSKYLGALIGLGILLVVAMDLPEIFGLLLAVVVLGAFVYVVVKWTKTNVR